MITALAILTLCQCVEFSSPAGYAEIIGSTQQQILFYERWRDYAAPDWQTVNAEWWRKENLRIRQNTPFNGRTLFSWNPVTRNQVLRTAIVYGYTLKFKVIVHPFGHFWFYYNSAWHAGITILALIAAIVYLRRRSQSRCVI